MPPRAPLKVVLVAAAAVAVARVLRTLTLVVARRLVPESRTPSGATGVTLRPTCRRSGATTVACGSALRHSTTTTSLASDVHEHKVFKGSRVCWCGVCRRTLLNSNDHRIHLSRPRTTGVASRT